MSHRIGNVVYICAEPERRCSECGKEAETRPYGKGGARICYSCAMKNQKETERNMARVLFGEKSGLRRILST